MDFLKPKETVQSEHKANKAKITQELAKIQSQSEGGNQEKDGDSPEELDRGTLIAQWITNRLILKPADESNDEAHPDRVQIAKLSQDPDDLLQRISIDPPPPDFE